MLDNRYSPAKNIALCGILIALAFAFAWVEHLIPIQLVVPIPGIRLGLANIISMFAVLYLSPSAAFAIILCRCLLQAALFGSVSGLMFSLCGGCLALVGMLLLHRYAFNHISLFGFSIAGAACHNIGQILCAVCYFRSWALLYYLPVLLLLSIPTGLLTGGISRLTFQKLQIMPDSPASLKLIQ